MLQNIVDKKVRVGVSFNGGVNTLGGTTLGGTEYYKGVVTSFDDNFIVLNNSFLIGIKYIQTIEIL